MNKECFHGNYLYLACVFIKEKECHNTDPVEFYIPNSLKHGLNNDPNIPNLSNSSTNSSHRSAAVVALSIASDVSVCLLVSAVTRAFSANFIFQIL